MAKTPVGPGSWEASQLPLDISGIQCESGHLNPSGATYCGTCGVGLESRPESAGASFPASGSLATSGSLAGRLRAALDRWSDKHAK